MPDTLTKQDKATLRKAAALIAATPSLKPSAALRKLGLRSEQRINRLRRALMTKAKTSVKRKRLPVPETARHQTVPLRTDSSADVMSQPIEKKHRAVSLWSANPIMAAQYEMWVTMLRWSPLGIMLGTSNATVSRPTRPPG